MLDGFPLEYTEPEGRFVAVNLQGAGAAVPTRRKGRNNYTVTRTGVGLLKIAFADDQGPTDMGLAGVGFSDVTTANVLGWTAVLASYTQPAGAVAGFATVAIGNAANALADLATTSSMTLMFAFKRAFTDD